jgi:hypothetical protein
MNPNVRMATKTLAAINAALEVDQGNLYRHYLQQVLPHIKDAYRQDEDKFRSHLGASVLGGECLRQMWYGWRWFTYRRFDGKTLRLFNRGHLEEARIIALLLMIKVQVYQQTPDGKQYTISHAGGHIGGSGDGVGIDIPDLEPGQPALLECKTHGDKSFNDLVDKGVRESKLEHYIQMQMYMRKMGLAVGLYCAVNKNTDDLHLELIILNPELCDQLFERGEKVVFALNPPKRISESPGFWKCRWCDHKLVCFGLQGAVVERNCRTCVASVPLPSGQWQCTMHNKFLTKEEQLRGCITYKSRE